MGDAKLPGIGAEDIGRAAYGIFQHPELIGRYIGVAGDHLTGGEMAAALTDAIGEEVVYNSVPPEVIRTFGLPSCECAKRGLEIRECIGRQISVNPDDVSACFPREQISTRASILSGLYMLLMLALAMLIGLLVLQVLKPKPARQSK